MIATLTWALFLAWAACVRSAARSRVSERSWRMAGVIRNEADSQILVEKGADGGHSEIEAAKAELKAGKGHHQLSSRARRLRGRRAG